MFNLILNSMSVFILQNNKHSFFTSFFMRLEEGGLFFMLPLLIMLLITLFLITKSILYLLRRDLPAFKKYVTLLNSMGLLALVWGMLGQLIGIIGMFDSVEQIGEISTHLFAGGLKVSALPPVFGFFIFIVSRVASIVFTWTLNEKEAIK